MDYLTDEDYIELINYLISGLQKCHADDVIRQIKALETVNVIEETSSAAEVAARRPPDLNQLVILGHPDFEEKPRIAKSARKSDKKADREAVSEYSSRPMSCEEMYHASIDILETYLLSVPKILEGIEKNLRPEGLSNIIWKNEGERHTEAAPVNIIEAVGDPEPKVQKEMEEIIKTLKNVPGKERI